MIRSSARLVITAFVLCLTAALPGEAQQVSSFKELSRLLSSGQPVSVTDASGLEVKGRFVTASDSSIALQTASGERVFAPDQVLQVRSLPDSLANGTLWGAAIGAGGGALAGLIADASRSQGSLLMPVMTAVGAGLGALLGLANDAASGPEPAVLYRRSTGGATLRLAPALSPARVAFQAALTF